MLAGCLLQAPSVSAAGALGVCCLRLAVSAACGFCTSPLLVLCWCSAHGAHSALLLVRWLPYSGGALVNGHPWTNMATIATNMAGTTTRASVDATTTAPIATVPTITAVATSGVGMSCLLWCVGLSCLVCGRVWLTRGMCVCVGGVH